jgi:hypothetical protein
MFSEVAPITGVAYRFLGHLYAAIFLFTRFEAASVGGLIHVDAVTD